MAKIMIVDDSLFMRNRIAKLLVKQGYETIVAENGEVAVSAYRRDSPDAVLMDITMPGLNGIEATRQIKKRFPHVKVLVLTMHATEEYIFQILKAGASGYVVKEAAPKELVEAVKTVCAWRTYSSTTLMETEGLR